LLGIRGLRKQATQDQNLARAGARSARGWSEGLGEPHRKTPRHRSIERSRKQEGFRKAHANLNVVMGAQQTTKRPQSRRLNPTCKDTTTQEHAKKDRNATGLY